MRSVAQAMQRNEVEVNELTSCYVVDLLTLYSRSEALFVAGEDGPELRPLALMLADAVDRGPLEHNRALKRVGDQALFVAGFLGEGLAKRLVDIDYYVSMGGGAYAALSASAPGTAASGRFADIFAELAANFVDFVDVLNDLRESAVSEHLDLLRLYETWVRTGSRRAARRLREHGIEPQQDLRAARKPH